MEKNRKLHEYITKYEKTMCAGKQYITFSKRNKAIHHVLLFLPGALCEEQFQSAFKQDGRRSVVEC